MTLDSESPFQRTCPSQEYDTNVIIHSDNPFIFTKDNHFMVDTLDMDNEGKDCFIHSSLIEKKRFKVTSPLQQFSDLEDSVNRNTGDDEYMYNPFLAPSSGFEMVVKEDFYTDKLVTEVEDPEINVCTEHDPCPDIRDMSIDKQIQSSDRLAVENEVNQMGCSVSNWSPDDGGHNDSASELANSVSADDLKYAICDTGFATVDSNKTDPASVLHTCLDENGISQGLFDNGSLFIDASVIDGISAKVIDVPADHVSIFDNTDREASLASSVISETKLDATESAVSTIPAEATESQTFQDSDVHDDCDGKGSFAPPIEWRVKVDTVESVEGNISPEVPDKRAPSLQEITTDSSMDLSSLHFINDKKQSLDEPKFKDLSEESNSGFTALPLFSEVSVNNENNESKETPTDCRVPGGVITFSFDGKEASTSGRDNNNEETTNGIQSDVVKNGPGSEEATIEGPISSSKCSFRYLMQGDSNFSEAGLLSGPIANSGHIPYSGSISLRSDSSTTSARSFAFPILQSEWNSSPVKMAKGDRRNLRKHRGWRMGLLCCRF